MDKQSEKEAAIWALAKVLFEATEKYDPSGATWDGIAQDDREFYYYTVRRLLAERELLDQARS